MIGSRRPIFALLILAPSIPELLTGSTPITLLAIDPLRFAFQMALNIGLYGTGALLIREASAKWNKGWATILLLGAAYGIMEEGIAVHTFFQSSGNPVGIMGTYGRAFGVNWVWVVGLTLFHSLYSISIPILLVQLLYPDIKRKPWMDRSLLALTAFVYLCVVTLIYSAVPNKPDIYQLAFFLSVVILLLIAGRFVPAELLKARPGLPTGRGFTIPLAAAMFFTSWIVVIVIASDNLIAPVFSVLILLCVSAASLKLILSRVGDKGNELAKLSAVTGFLSILFLWDVFVEFSSVPGILFVSAAFIYFLFRLHKRLEGKSLSAVPRLQHSA